MLHRLKSEYHMYYANLRVTYAGRIRALEEAAHSSLLRYANNTLHLYTKDPMRKVSLKTIQDDLINAAKAGCTYVEYTINTYLYQAWEGDNVSVITGTYYLHPEKLFITEEHSYITLLQKTFPELTITFTEKTVVDGVLRIEFSVS